MRLSINIKLVVVCLVGQFAVRSALADPVTVLRVDAQKKVQAVGLTEARFASELENLIEMTSESVNQVGEQSERDEAAVAPACEKTEAFHLDSVTVGIGFKVEAGLGPIITVGVKPRFRFVYSKNSDPKFVE